MKRMVMLTTVCAIVAIGVGAQLARASVPRAITEHIAEVTQWAYRGGDTNRYPLCGSTCSELWTAEHAPSERDPFATELWREMEKLRERIELLPLLGSVLGERGLTSAQRIGVKMGGSTSRLMWLEVELPAAAPPTSIERGAEEPEEYVLNFHPAGATVAAVRLLKDAWVIGGRYGSGSVLDEVFQDLCGPGRGIVGYKPPVGGVLMAGYGSAGCAPTFLATSTDWLYALPSPVITPSEDYTTQTASAVVLHPYPQWDPGQSTVQEEITSQLETHADEYVVFIRWLDHHLGGASGDPLDAATYLEQHDPIYAFDREENFYPQKASAFTDTSASVSPYYLEDANKLYSGSTVLAAGSSPGTGGLPPVLTLETLGTTYNLGESHPTASRSDYIDAHGTDERTAAEDSALARLNGDGTTVYGRLVLDLANQKVWLQYWVFYYYNSSDFLGLGLHEGDWEMSQVALDSQTLRPVEMTFSIHDTSGRGCSWGLVQTDEGREHPVVYLGAGSHASYPDAETSEIEIDGIGTPVQDYHRGNGVIEEAPPVEVVNGQSWWEWPGRWGADDGSGLFDAASPQSPSQQGDKWSDPSAFDANSDHSHCTSG